MYTLPIMYAITQNQLRDAAPACKHPELWAPLLTDAMQTYGLAADRGNVVEFLAQCAHESQEFNRLEENLNYSAQRLMAVWPKRFPTLASAVPYARNPAALANRVYANRMGNRNEASGDGWRTRGRGLIMVTGTDNYVRVGKLIRDLNLLQHPERLSSPEGAAMSAAAWWMDNPRLRALAVDESDDDDEADFVAITRIVNGGAEGLKARARYRDAFSIAVP